MSENVTRDRAWRVDVSKSSPKQDAASGDQLPVTGAGGLEIEEVEPPALDPISRTIRDFRRWGDRLRNLVPSRKGHAASGENRVETIVYDFAETLAATIDPTVVVSELVFAAKRLTGASRVELIFETATEATTDTADAGIVDQEPPASGEEVPPLVVTVGYGTKNWGALRLAGTPGKQWERRRSGHSIRPLKALCTLAAMALDGISTNQLFESLETSDLGPCSIDPDEETASKPGVSVRDATYLNVILPYALSQAKRHHETLSILYVGIDRLSSIHELLGPEMVTRAVNHVGEIVINRLRSSDVVSRMEDDRVLAMLPFATASDASRIAEEIRKSVEEKCSSLEDMPSLTVSIGVASFPTHAKEVYSLLNAADESMSAAQDEGRNRVALAANPACS